ncbi:MAG: hypothetical protein ACO2ZM_01890 [Francisellaceae bacterium]
MNKFMTAVFAGFMISGTAFAADPSTVLTKEDYFNKMQTISQQMDLQKAQNALLNAQLEQKQIEQKLQSLQAPNTDSSKNAAHTNMLSAQLEAQAPVKNNNSNAHTAMDFKVKILQIMGPVDDLNAEINYNNQSAKIRKGSVLENTWEVSHIGIDHVDFINLSTHGIKTVYFNVVPASYRHASTNYQPTNNGGSEYEIL